jgi:hypothetical protein
VLEWDDRNALVHLGHDTPPRGDAVVRRELREEEIMLQPKCDVCGQPATIHETAVENGTAVARHYCAEHGEASWQATAPAIDPAAVQTLEEYWRGLSDAEKEQLAELYRLSKDC